MEIYSKRKRATELVGQPVVYRYDSLPKAFKNQIKYIWRVAIGHYFSYAHKSKRNEVWNHIEDRIRREHGLPLDYDYYQKSNEWCEEYFDEDKDIIDKDIDLIEIAFILINGFIREKYGYMKNNYRVNQLPDLAIAELNKRFTEHSLGYQFTNGQIIRIDSQFIHKEITLPMLKLIHDAEFLGVEEEFMKSHKYYKEGDYKGVLVESLKVLESTLKAICDHKKWNYDRKITATGLLKIVFDKGLIPPYLEAQFNNLKGLLESGVPPVRNAMGGHGQGIEISYVPEYIARYALHSTATNILFLINAYREGESIHKIVRQ